MPTSEPMPRVQSESRTFRMDLEVYATEEQLEAAMDKIMAALDDLSPSIGTTWVRADV